MVCELCTAVTFYRHADLCPQRCSLAVLLLTLSIQQLVSAWPSVLATADEPSDAISSAVGAVEYSCQMNRRRT